MKSLAVVTLAVCACALLAVTSTDAFRLASRLRMRSKAMDAFEVCNSEAPRSAPGAELLPDVTATVRGQQGAEILEKESERVTLVHYELPPSRVYICNALEATARPNKVIFFKNNRVVQILESVPADFFHKLHETFADVFPRGKAERYLYILDADNNFVFAPEFQSFRIRGPDGRETPVTRDVVKHGDLSPGEKPFTRPVHHDHARVDPHPSIGTESIKEYHWMGRYRGIARMGGELHRLVDKWMLNDLSGYSKDRAPLDRMETFHHSVGSLAPQAAAYEAIKDEVESTSLTPEQFHRVACLMVKLGMRVHFTPFVVKKGGAESASVPWSAAPDCQGPADAEHVDLFWVKPKKKKEKEADESKPATI